jgi:hypothetical protein
LVFVGFDEISLCSYSKEHWNLKKVFNYQN